MVGACRQPTRNSPRAHTTTSVTGGRSWVGVVRGCEKPSTTVEESIEYLAKHSEAFRKALWSKSSWPANVGEKKAIQKDGSSSQPLHPGGLGSCTCRGRVVQILSTYGWIEPLDAIDHPDLDLHGGHIWFSFNDVRAGTALVLGLELTFGLYANIDGLGAEDCHIPISEETSSHWTPLSAVAKSAKSFKYTPLSGTAMPFTPGLAWNHCVEAVEAAHCVAAAEAAKTADRIRGTKVLTDCFVSNGSQVCDKVEKVGGKNIGGASNESDAIVGDTCVKAMLGSRDSPIDFEDLENVQPHKLFSQGFLPPPGLPPPPGLEEHPSLKIEG